MLPSSSVRNAAIHAAQTDLPGTAGVSPALDRATGIGIGVAVSGSAGGTPAIPGGSSRVGKSRKRRETVHALARRAPLINRRRGIGVTERHAAEQHVLARQVETGRYGLVPMGPRLDAAGVQALAAGKQHNGLDEHAEVRPLRRPHGAVDGKEQPDRRTKQLKIARILAITPSAVLARNPDRMIELRADLTAPAIIWLLEGIRVDLVSGPLPPGVRRRIWTDAGLEIFERLTCERMDPPRLQIAARRRARGAIEDVAHRCEGHRGRQKRAATEPGGYGVAHMHGVAHTDQAECGRRVIGGKEHTREFE